MAGKTAGDVGRAYNPQTNEYEELTRSEAAQRGLQNFDAKGYNQSNERQLNTRLADVATKITRYEDTMQAPLSSKDRGLLASALEDDKLKASVFGAEIPVDWMNQLAKSSYINQMSTEGAKRLYAYMNARESIQGYQRVLTGGSRSSDKGLELNLQTVPGPLIDADKANEGLNQFKENVQLANQGIARMKGIPTAGDILRNNESVQVQIPGHNPGTIKRGRLAEFQRKYPSARVSQ